MEITVPRLRDWDSLHPVSKDLYKKTYFSGVSNYDGWLVKSVDRYMPAGKYRDDFKQIIRNRWAHMSTPPSTGLGLPISCYVSDVGDSRDEIFYNWLEGAWLGAGGGGRGVNYDRIGGSGRPIGIPADKLAKMTWSEIQGDKSIPKSTGAVMFSAANDRITYVVSQANVRRSSEAIYLDVSHPDILNFIDMRNPVGDKNKRMPNLHHGVKISNKFLKAKDNLESWDLICRETGQVTETVDALDLWLKILATRFMVGGEPFIINVDNVNKYRPPEYVKEDLRIESSNICTEIFQHTDSDKTAVCALMSWNLEYWDEYSKIPGMIDYMAKLSTIYLNGVLDYYVAEVEKFDDKFLRKSAFRKALNSVKDERNIGIGQMGFSSYLQKMNIPFESPMAKGLNKEIFKTIRKALDDYQASVPDELVCPMSKRNGTHRQNILTMATAPTWSISMLADMTSSGIEHSVGNVFTKSTAQGIFTIKNKYLEKIINDYATDNHLGNEWVNRQWDTIIEDRGSVANLDWLSNWNKDVFKTAFEVNQLAVVDLAIDRTPYIDQGQSLNIFLKAGATWEELDVIHSKLLEHSKGCYYLRTEEEVKVDTKSRERKTITYEDKTCVTCQ